jgi:hypothetical protein
VTTREREQTHKTPVTSTWTVDFLTREGEGHQAVGDWLRDKTISWKEWRRILQTNADVFPSETRLQKWGKHPEGISERNGTSTVAGMHLRQYVETVGPATGVRTGGRCGKTSFTLPPCPYFRSSRFHGGGLQPMTPWADLGRD